MVAGAEEEQVKAGYKAAAWHKGRMGRICPPTHPCMVAGNTRARHRQAGSGRNGKVVAAHGEWGRQQAENGAQGTRRAGRWARGRAWARGR